MLPRKVVTSDAATDTNIEMITKEKMSQTDATPPAIVGAIEVLPYYTAENNKPDSVNSDKITDIQPTGDISNEKL